MRWLGMHSTSRLSQQALTKAHPMKYKAASLHCTIFDRVYFIAGLVMSGRIQLAGLVNLSTASLWHHFSWGQCTCATSVSVCLV